MSEISEQGFSLKSREEVIRFETLAEAYAQEKIFLFPLKHISLIDAFDFCQTEEEGAKLFTALLDIYINFLMLWSDSMSAGRAWEDGVEIDKLESGSILDSETKFFRKMELHKYHTSFIFRYRALWDKAMGFSVLFFAPNEYESFISSRSKRRSFKKIFSTEQAFPNEFVTFLDTHLDEFESKLRTPEAHGTGALRKRSFSMQPIEESPMVEFGQYWNIMNLMMIAVGMLFSPDKKIAAMKIFNE
jgi:hypothetical protein